MGTETEEAASGTIEEINRFVESGKRVSLYFSEKNIPNDCDLDQLSKLRNFKTECFGKGLVDLFIENEGLPCDFVII